MTTIEYTETYHNNYDFTSSAIDDIYYNENDGSAVIDINGEIYRYNNVPLDAVVRLVNASSVGAHYNTRFKPTYGPAEHLGWWGSVKRKEVPVANGVTQYVGKDFESAPVEKDLVSSGFANGPSFTISGVSGEGITLSADGTATFSAKPTKEYSLAIPPDAPTKEYSLQTPVVKTVTAGSAEFPDTVLSTVFFTIDGGDKVYEFASRQTDLVDAIDEVNDYVSVLGAKGKVVRVVFDFR